MRGLVWCVLVWGFVSFTSAFLHVCFRGFSIWAIPIELLSFLVCWVLGLLGFQVIILVGGSICVGLWS